jgi:hypothetical protein
MSEVAKQQLISQKFGNSPISATVQEFEDEAMEQAALFLGSEEEVIGNHDNDEVYYTSHDIPTSQLVDVCGILFKKKTTETNHYK